MPSQDIVERFKALKALSDKLCEQDNKANSAIQARDWLVNQLKVLREMVERSETTKECITCRIDDILCVVEPDCNVGEQEDVS